MSEPEKNEEIERAPEGTVCRAHEDREGVVFCPSCQRGACLMCWHGMYMLCDTCLREDPANAVAPVPLEDPERNAVVGFFATLAQAFTPTKSAPSFARAELKRPLIFGALTMLLLAPLAGIVPFTHRIRFGHSFGTELINSPTPDQLKVDVAQAAGLGLLFHLAVIFALAICFVSLVRAYGTHELKTKTAVRAILYRGWLAPLAGRAGVLVALVNWGLPADPSSTLMLILSFVIIAPTILLFVHLRATARFACGVPPVMSFVVVIVPFVFMMAAEGLLGSALAPILPDPEELQSVEVSDDVETESAQPQESE